MKKSLQKALIMAGLLVFTGCSFEKTYYVDVSKIKNNQKEVRVYDTYVTVDKKGKKINILGNDIEWGNVKVYYMSSEETKNDVERYLIIKNDKVLYSFNSDDLTRKGLKPVVNKDFENLKKEGVNCSETSLEMKEKLNRVKSFLNTLLFVKQKQGKTPTYTTNYTFDIFSIADAKTYTGLKNEAVEDQFSTFTGALYEIFWDRKTSILKNIMTGNEYSDTKLDSFKLNTWDAAEEQGKKFSYKTIGLQGRSIKYWGESSEKIRQNYESIISNIDNIFTERYGNKPLSFKIQDGNFEYILSYDYKTAKAKIPKSLSEILEKEMTEALSNSKV